MKKILCLLIITANLIISYGQDNFCDPVLLDEVNNYPMKDGAIWLKDFTVNSDAVENNYCEIKPQYSVVLKANSIYRFLIKSSPKFDGKAKLSILDGNIVLKSTTYQTGKIPEFVDIEIKETKIYHILVTFQDGKKGCAAFDIYLVNN